MQKNRQPSGQSLRDWANAAVRSILPHRHSVAQRQPAVGAELDPGPLGRAGDSPHPARHGHVVVPVEPVVLDRTDENTGRCPGPPP
jgi:hypothetical protein